MDTVFVIYFYFYADSFTKIGICKLKDFLHLCQQIMFKDYSHILKKLDIIFISLINDFGRNYNNLIN